MNSTDFSFPAIGTHWQIDIFDDVSQEKKDELIKNIKSRIETFEQNYSRFRSSSLISQMSREAGTYTLPEDAEPLFSLYHNLYKLTHGIFTPLIGNVLVDAGYDANYSLTPQKELHMPPAWDDVIEYNFPILTMNQPAVLDFGAAGKGYIIDIISELIRNAGIQSFCVDAGGDMYYQYPHGEQLDVGLENPENKEQVIGVAHILNQSICGSSGNRRSWHQFHHIINPETLISPINILATWTIASTTMIADAMATCLYFIPANTLQKEYTFEYLIMFADHSIETSSHFPAQFFTQNTP